jgi:uncharacterized lipoprotein YajG
MGLPMKNYLKWALVFLFSFLLMGCATSLEYITPNIAMHTNRNNMGHEKTVALSVKDERAHSQITLRHSLTPPAVYSVLLSNGAMQQIYGAAQHGLNAHNFKVVNYGAHRHESTTLSITLTHLVSEIVPTSYGPSVNTLVSSTIVVHATRPGASYEKTYRADVTAPVPWSYTRARDQRLIDTVLSRNINRIFFDKKLTAFLAGH